jgi:hypothetical protein
MQLARSIEVVLDEILFVVGFAVFVMAGTEDGHMRVDHGAPGAIQADGGTRAEVDQIRRRGRAAAGFRMMRKMMLEIR